MAMFRAHYESLPPDRFMGRNLVRDRLRELARSAYIGAAEGNDVQSGVLAAASDPRVAPVLERVTRTRLAFLERPFEALGLDPPAARARARMAYALYVGLGDLRRAAPQAPMTSPRSPPWSSSSSTPCVPGLRTRRGPARVRPCSRQAVRMRSSNG
jgi:hypothetical protein